MDTPDAADDPDEGEGPENADIAPESDGVDESEGPEGGRSVDDIAASAVDEVDGRIVDLLSWILDTETRAKIYVFLLGNPGSTSEEVAKGTGLYPSTVREALAELHDERRVTRGKRASEGAGNNPYEYTSIQPSELVGGVVDQVQRELNTIFTLDSVLDRDEPESFDEDAEPVTITVDDTSDTPFDDGADEDANPNSGAENADTSEENEDSSAEDAEE